MKISDEAVEAAARAMAPAAWGPSVWQFAAHGETPTDARDRVQKQALQDARLTLEAAAPHLMAAAWDEGGRAAIEREHAYGREEKAKFSNPYRSASGRGMREDVDLMRWKLAALAEWAQGMIEESSSPQYGRDVKSLLEVGSLAEAHEIDRM